MSVSIGSRTHRICVVKGVYCLIYACIALIFFEALFFLTKPSFFDELSLYVKALAIAQALFLVLVGVGVSSIPCWIFILLCPKSRMSLASHCAALPSALVNAFTLFSVTDIFVKTWAGLGVIGAHGVSRVIFAITYLAFFALCQRKTVYVLKSAARRDELPPIPPTISIVLWVMLGVAGLSLCTNSPTIHDIGTENAAAHPYNILMISSDGINADRMSVYGYEKRTTPFLEQLSDQFVIYENAYANCNRTDCSIASMLSGQHPLSSGVLYDQSFFSGRHASDHFVGVLKRLGYYTFDVCVLEECDPYALNVLEVFDYADGAGTVVAGLGQYLPYVSKVFTPGTVFFDLILRRMVGKVHTITFLGESKDPFIELKSFEDPEHIGNSTERLNEFLGVLKDAPQPFFGHLHLLTTHGPYFNPTKPYFSSGKVQKEEWEVGPHYDDTILEFDQQLAELFRVLKAKGALENTIIVLSSDHGNHYTTQHRVPLMIYAPGFKKRARVKENVQYLDIAPTILSLIGVPIPEWVDGRALTQTYSASEPLLLVERHYEDLSSDPSAEDSHGTLSYYAVQCSTRLSLNEKGECCNSQKAESPVAACSDLEQEMVRTSTQLIPDLQQRFNSRR